MDGLVLRDAEAPPAEKESRDRLTLRLSPDARETLQWIADQRGGVPFVEVIRRALGTERFLIDAQKNGARILVEQPGQRLKEIVLV
jgi:hypothetical protein